MTLNLRQTQTETFNQIFTTDDLRITFNGERYNTSNKIGKSKRERVINEKGEKGKEIKRVAKGEKGNTETNELIMVYLKQE